MTNIHDNPKFNDYQKFLSPSLTEGTTSEMVPSQWMGKVIKNLGKQLEVKCYRLAELFRTLLKGSPQWKNNQSVINDFIKTKDHLVTLLNGKASPDALSKEIADLWHLKDVLKEIEQRFSSLGQKKEVSKHISEASKLCVEMTNELKKIRKTMTSPAQTPLTAEQQQEVGSKTTKTATAVRGPNVASIDIAAKKKEVHKLLDNFMMAAYNYRNPLDPSFMLSESLGKYAGWGSKENQQLVELRKGNFDTASNEKIFSDVQTAVLTIVKGFDQKKQIVPYHVQGILKQLIETLKEIDPTRGEEFEAIVNQKIAPNLEQLPQRMTQFDQRMESLKESLEARVAIDRQNHLQAIPVKTENNLFKEEPIIRWENPKKASSSELAKLFRMERGLQVQTYKLQAMLGKPLTGRDLIEQNVKIKDWARKCVDYFQAKGWLEYRSFADQMLALCQTDDIFFERGVQHVIDGLKKIIPEGDDEAFKVESILEAIEGKISKK